VPSVDSTVASHRRPGRGAGRIADPAGVACYSVPVAAPVRQRAIVTIAMTATLSGAALGIDSAPEWPGFRGPGMRGLAPDARLPERWSKTTNVRWSVEVPSRATPSPSRRR
jgi:hypothetical protein